MATYNTSSDSANTAVRAFLTKVGEYYLGHSYNTASGKGKKIWQDIKDSFNNSCAYCGEKNIKLQLEHVYMFNREEYGLHHPGNTIPCCVSCNKRKRINKSYYSWEQHLQATCDEKNESDKYLLRKKKIEDNFQKYSYPNLNQNEIHSIQVIANSLYENIKNESEKSLQLYKKLDEVFVKNENKIESF